MTDHTRPTKPQFLLLSPRVACHAAARGFIIQDTRLVCFES